MRLAWRIFAVVVLSAICCGPAAAQSGGELRMVLRSEPRTFHPHLAGDEASETVAFLTSGRLIRINRKTQQATPELATSWKISEGGKRIRFKLREGVRFSDGTPFTAADVEATVRSMSDPKSPSPHGGGLRASGGAPQFQVHNDRDITITFPAVIADLEREFDGVAILSASSTLKERAALGPFVVAEHKAGDFILLKRNPHYWKRDGAGNQLPYLDSVRLDILQNRETELLRFRRGEIHLINSLDAEHFDRLQKEMSGSVIEPGPSFDVEQAWFNMVPEAPIPAHRKEWFRSRNFRRAVSEAINRHDICRVVFMRHASPAVGPVSPANQFWFNRKLAAHPYDPQAALSRLQGEGFALREGKLYDRSGNRVEFSLITNAGNKARERMAAMMQQDLARIGIQLNIVTLDMQSVVGRIMESRDYEMILLGLVNVDIEPMAQMNVWVSSGPMHAWNPGQKSPATPWEAEIDRLMRAQASTANLKARKNAFDRVQQIVWEEAPILYLVHKNTMVAVSPALKNVVPVTLRPQTFWNIEYLQRAAPGGGQ